MDELDTVSFEELSSISYDYLLEQQEICEDLYQISTYENWFYDQETAELTFSNGDVKKLIIKYEDVGSVSLYSNTWMWSWANDNKKEQVKLEIKKVRKYGEKRDFEKLITDTWPAEEVDGWHMAAISAYLLGAKGAYRIPLRDDTLFSFLIFREIRWAE